MPNKLPNNSVGLVGFFCLPSFIFCLLKRGGGGRGGGFFFCTCGIVSGPNGSLKKTIQN